MTTIRNWLQEFTEETGENITMLRIECDDDREDGWWPPGWPRFAEGKAMPPEMFNGVIDAPFNEHQSPNFQLVGWSQNWIVYSKETSMHDTTLARLPRHPTDSHPAPAP